MSTPIVFVDIETTGLDPVRYVPWEVAVIRREADGAETEYLWQLGLSRWELEDADPTALEIGQYTRRNVVPPVAEAVAMLPSYGDGDGYRLVPLRDAVGQIARALDGAVMVGSNPHFDASFLRRLLAPRATPWHYRPVDIATLAAGYLRGRGAAVALPYSSRGLSRAVGVEPPGEGVAHTALGDAAWARDVYLAVMGGAS